MPNPSEVAIDNWPGLAALPPVPLTPIVMEGPPVRLTLMVPLSAPETVGWNATANVHLLFGTTLPTVIPEH